MTNAAGCAFSFKKGIFLPIHLESFSFLDGFPNNILKKNILELNLQYDRSFVI